jgi:hypothetical protein
MAQEHPKREGQSSPLSIHLIPTPHPLQSLPRPIPEDRMINLTLFYYDDRTPEGYQPKGFKDVSETVHPSFMAQVRTLIV